MAKCIKCGFVNNDDYIFCMQCGQRMKTETDDIATIITSEDAKNSAPFDDNIPKTRVVTTLDSMSLEGNDESPGEKTKLFKPAESRINPQLVEIKDDLSSGKIHEITKLKTYLGRSDGDILYPNDTYLSLKHCVFYYSEGKFFVEDINSYNGVFIRIKERIKLSSGAYILIGQQLIQFFPFDYKDLLIPDKPETEEIVNFYGISNRKIIALIKQLFSDHSEGNRYYISSESVTIGRQAGDILFPEDKFMSNKHAIIVYEQEEFWLIDNGSSNGVFIQIVGKTEVNDGDNLLIGKQLFEYRAPTI
jgi:pSer/pThr/pTyr-binding forkhead associated (FHA) protein